MKNNQNFISLAALLAIVGFFAYFRIRKVRKAYLTTVYDHYINGLVLGIGSYVGYAELIEPDLVSTTGSEFSGGFPIEDVELRDGWIVEKRT